VIAAEWGSALERFEVARRVLGHAAVAPHPEARLLITGEGESGVRCSLIRYATVVVAVRDDLTEGWVRIPVIPEVDVANLRVRHQTCTGNTTFTVDGELVMSRAIPLDIDSPRDVALWLLPDMAVCDTGPIFGTPTGRRTTPGNLVTLEALAALVAAGMNLGVACRLATKRGIPAEPGPVLRAIGDRRVGLLLSDRPWCQRAYQHLSGGAANLPEWAETALTAKRTASRRGRDGVVLRDPKPPTPPRRFTIEPWELGLDSEGASE
jgi:hypothetical protein